MKKLSFKTPDLSIENIEKLQKLFPNVVTEKQNEVGQIVKSIDFDLLRQLLSDSIVEDENERYRLDWPGKKASLLKANTPITKTLRPIREESVNFDTTQNLYIEGDNFEALKILQESYLGKIKMIYIDPPYNTGKDFVYKDNRSVSKEDYEDQLGVEDEEGGKLFRNTDTNGRFHSDWLSMMYERLLIARDLLKDDGVIFMSIDDNEVHNLRKISDEVFGEDNFIINICHKSRASVSNDKIVSPNHNHILLYAKDIEVIESIRSSFGIEPDLNGFTNRDEMGEYKLVPVDGPGGAMKGNPYYEFLGIKGYWRFSKTTMQKMYENGLIIKKENSLQQKYYKQDAEKTRKTVTSWWDDKFYTSNATRSLAELMGGKVFDNPKHLELITRMLTLHVRDDNDIVLDYFSGSATTAHALLLQNARDGVNRKFIMIQLPEETDVTSEAYKSGYLNICQIGKERIRRAGKKIIADFQEQLEKRETPLDIGFRVYKVDSTNMKDVYYHPSDLTQTTLETLIDNVKDDRTSEDLLTQVMLDLGLELTLPIEVKEYSGHKVFFVQGNTLIACFEKIKDFSIVDDLAKLEPLKVVLKDSSFVDDKDRINFENRFKRFSPDTQITVI
ncbi:MAG: site-specific DNA-methyltransferase [Candidatus Dojkabacteria bacterium]|nr:MAG: site-specific DNA-methyltransferase [Candidatus Dojkabacteria bacterium]